MTLIQRNKTGLGAVRTYPKVSIRESEAGICEFKTSQGYKVRCYPKHRPLPKQKKIRVKRKIEAEVGLHGAWAC